MQLTSITIIYESCPGQDQKGKIRAGQQAPGRVGSQGSARGAGLITQLGHIMERQESRGVGRTNEQGRVAQNNGTTAEKRCGKSSKGSYDLIAQACSLFTTPGYWSAALWKSSASSANRLQFVSALASNTLRKRSA